MSWDGLEVTFLHGPNGPTFEGYQLRAPLPPQVVIFAEPGAEGVEAGKACD
ncbi:MAG: hypothetical protein GY698_08875 [Actinomycetia bacterium]|nr:hypothetical protein [Actinomycetes bacterium]